MREQTPIVYRGPGAFRIAAGVFMGLVVFTVFVAATISILLAVGVLNVAGIL